MVNIITQDELTGDIYKFDVLSQRSDCYSIAATTSNAIGVDVSRVPFDSKAVVSACNLPEKLLESGAYEEECRIHVRPS